LSAPVDSGLVMSVACALDCIAFTFFSLRIRLQAIAFPELVGPSTATTFSPLISFRMF
jgi:hypothetical protein